MTNAPCQARRRNIALQALTLKEVFVHEVYQYEGPARRQFVPELHRDVLSPAPITECAMIGADGLVAVNGMTHDDAITALMHAGMALFPCQPGRKEPATPRGFKNAKVLPESLIDAGTPVHGWPDQHNIGLATGFRSGVEVLDVDRKSGVDGFRALRTLHDAGLLNGHVATATTPSGGMHLFFPASGSRSGSAAGVGLDWKANGGYVLTSPSSILALDTGRLIENSYRWDSSSTIATGQPFDWVAAQKVLGIYKPPVPVRHSAVLAEEPMRVAERLARALETMTIGRNNALYWACRKVVEAGGGESEIDVLVNASIQLSGPGEDREAECRSTARSALGSPA